MQITPCSTVVSIEMSGSLSLEWSVLVVSEWWRKNEAEWIELMNEWTDG